MLKFRMTNSMKARRAAEAQRKALEDKLKMEWAWKPMAAVMNEKESDLVYWVPPLYTSNLLNSSNSSIYSASSSPSSSVRIGSSFKRQLVKPRSASLTQAPTSDELPRRKLAQRRTRIFSQEDIREVQSKTIIEDDKNENICKEYLQDDILPLDADDGNYQDTLKKNGHKKLRRTTSRNFRKRNSSKLPNKFAHLPTLLKVVNKLSTIYSLPTRPTPYVAAKKLERNKEFRNSSIKKPKRPSVKIYSVPFQRCSLKKGKLTEEPTKPEPFYVITKTKTPFGSRQQSLRENKEHNRTHIGLPTLSENELKHAHLEMIFRLLSLLYEEKLNNQNTIISQLKSKLSTQEKVIKQTARMVLILKDKVKIIESKVDFEQKLKQIYNQRSLESECHSSFPYHPLESLPEEYSSYDVANNCDKINSYDEESNPADIGESKKSNFLEKNCQNHLMVTNDPSTDSKIKVQTEDISYVMASVSINNSSYKPTSQVIKVSPSSSDKLDQSSILLGACMSILKPEEIQRRASTPVELFKSATIESKKARHSLDFTPLRTRNEYDQKLCDICSCESLDALSNTKLNNGTTHSSFDTNKIKSENKHLKSPETSSKNYKSFLQIQI